MLPRCDEILMPGLDGTHIKTSIGLKRLLEMQVKVSFKMDLPVVGITIERLSVFIDFFRHKPFKLLRYISQCKKIGHLLSKRKILGMRGLYLTHCF
jgi:hypothetical protein